MSSAKQSAHADRTTTTRRRSPRSAKHACRRQKLPLEIYSMPTSRDCGLNLSDCNQSQVRGYSTGVRSCRDAEGPGRRPVAGAEQHQEPSRPPLSRCFAYYLAPSLSLLLFLRYPFCTPTLAICISCHMHVRWPSPNKRRHAPPVAKNAAPGAGAASSTRFR